MITLALSAALLALSDSSLFIRVNQVGYLPGCAEGRRRLLARQRAHRHVQRAGRSGTHGVRSAARRRAANGVRPLRRHAPARFQRAAHARPLSHRRRRGAFARGAHRRDVYAGAADTLLYYMRQQRSGWNPVFRRLRAHARWHHRGLAARRRSSCQRVRRLGRRVGLPAVRHDVGERDVRHADGVSRSSARLRRSRSRRTGCPGANGQRRRARRSAPRPRVAARACSRATARCTTSSPTIAITRSSTCRRTIRRTTAGARARSGRCIRAPAGRRDCSEQEPLDRHGRRRPASTRRRSRSGVALRAARSGVRAAAARAQAEAGVSRRARANPGRLPDRARRARPTSTRRTTGWTTWSSAPPSSRR